MNSNLYLSNIKNLIKKYKETQNQRLLVYAILELRMCIENIAENILKQYSNILSDNDIKKRKATDIMNLLSKYDEHINYDLKFYIVFENDSKEKIYIGDYKALLKKKKLSRLYTELGSYLHYQENNNNITLDKLKEYISLIEHILKNENQIYASLRENINFDCEICGRRNIFSKYYIDNNEIINCQNNNCNILLKPIIEDENYKFKPIEPNIKCECGKYIYYKVAPEKLYMGYLFKCNSCNK